MTVTDSDFESGIESLSGNLAGPKRKRNLQSSRSFEKGIASDKDGAELETAEAGGAVDDRWDISKLRRNLPSGPCAISQPASQSRGSIARLPPKLKRYTPRDEEQLEGPDLEVMNESPPDEGEEGSMDDLPCRTLDNFIVYDQEDKNATVELDDVGMEDMDITISGNVEPQQTGSGGSGSGGAQDDFDDLDDDNDCESECGDGTVAMSRPASCSGTQAGQDSGDSDSYVQRIRLSAILNYETFLTPGGETEVWVRTCFAFYKLLTPHPGYAAIYTPLFKSVYIAHQAVLRARTTPDLSVAQFARILRESPSDTISRLSPITENDFRKYRELIVEEIQICLECTDSLELLSASLIQALCNIGTGRKPAKRARSGANSLARGARTTEKSISSGEPKDENPACITPLIATIAQGLYARHLLRVSNFDAKQTAPRAGANSDSDGPPADKADLWKKRYTRGSKAKVSDVKGVVSLADLQANTRVQCFRADSVVCSQKDRIHHVEDDVLHYKEVRLVPRSGSEGGDPVLVRVGETILLHAPMAGGMPDPLWESPEQEPTDADVAPAKASSGALARVIQVTRISCSLLDGQARWMVHGRPLLPGRDTLLQEVAHPNEWYLADSCRSYWLLSGIRGKLDVSFVPTAQDVDVDRWVEERRIFCRFWYDDSCGAFQDVNQEIQGIDGRMPLWCRSCNRKQNTADPKLGRVITGTRRVVRDPSADCSSLSTPKAPAPARVCTEYVESATVNGVEYHVSDTAYLLSTQNNQPFQIGHIMRFVGGPKGSGRLGSTVSKLQVEMQVLKRMRVLPPDNRPEGVGRSYNDERHLYWTPMIQLFEASHLRGKCWVSHPDEVGCNLTAYKDSDVNAFYAQYECTQAWPNSKEDWIELKPADTSVAVEDDHRMPMPDRCPVCRHERERRMRLMKQFLSSPSSAVAPSIKEPAVSHGKLVSFARGRQPLRALDLFSGCGGLTQGMDQSGIVKTCWSVEYMPSAGYTFAKNHKDAQVYNQCSNLLLDWAIKAHHGEETAPLINKFDGKALPPMPQPGDVDFIYCGPPCQGFSRCNRYIKADDIKTSLIANALSYVDFYRPTYFLLENVRGLLMYRLGGVQVGPGKVQGGIEMGMLKFIMRSLTTMGYQARFYVLQAGNYGLAQSRRRLFIWACKRGCQLPGVPMPSSTFSKSGQTNIRFPNGFSYAPFASLNGNAPHHEITVEDAIGDLPKFEYVNPEESYPDPDIAIRNRNWPQYVAVDGRASGVPGDEDGRRGYVGHMQMEYSSPPLSEFQRLRRRKVHICLPGADGDYGDLIDTLHNHVARKFKAVNVERICRVVLEPGMDHHSLPEKLKPWCLHDKASAAARHNGWKGLFGRVDPKGSFGTALTDMQPMGKSGTVLLYDQRRVLSVRECARAQGFPDNFQLFSMDRNAVRDMYRQIGNAVPPPLAYALSLKLREALFSDFVKNTPEDDAGVNDILGDCCVDITQYPKRPHVSYSPAPSTDESMGAVDSELASTVCAELDPAAVVPDI